MLLAPPVGVFTVPSVPDVFAPLPVLPVDEVGAELLGLLPACVFVLPEPALLLCAPTDEFPFPLLPGVAAALSVVVGTALSIVLLGAVVGCVVAPAFVEDAEVGSTDWAVVVLPVTGGSLSEGPLSK